MLSDELSHTRVPAIQQRPSTHVLYSTRNVHTHVVSCTSQNAAQTCTTDMECDIIMKRQ